MPPTSEEPVSSDATGLSYLHQIQQTPVVGAVLFLAVVITAVYWSKPEWFNALDHWQTSPMLTVPYLLLSTFIHGDTLHLLFNGWWVWQLGRRIEVQLGSLVMVGVVAVLGIGSGAAETAFANGGVGLSGVVYGLAAYAWMYGRLRPSEQSMISESDVRLLFGWFFFCIFATVTELWAIANFAHGGGAVLGVVVAWGVCGQRAAALGVMGVVLTGLLAGATVLRPHVNLFGNQWAIDHDLGRQALIDDRAAVAIPHLQRSLVARNDVASTWYLMCVAQTDQGLLQQAYASCERSLFLERTPEVVAQLMYVQESRSVALMEANDPDALLVMYEKSLEYLYDPSASLLESMGWAWLAKGDLDKSAAAYERAAKKDPEATRYREILETIRELQADAQE